MAKILQNELEAGYYYILRTTKEDIPFRVLEKRSFFYKSGSVKEGEFDFLDAGAVGVEKDFSIFQPGENELIQVVPGTKQQIDFYLQSPAGDTRTFNLLNTPGRAYFNVENAPYPFDFVGHRNEFFEMWFFAKQYPRIKAVNRSGIKKMPTVYFIGFRYKIQKVPEREIAGLTVPIITIGGE